MIFSGWKTFYKCGPNVNELLYFFYDRGGKINRFIYINDLVVLMWNHKIVNCWLFQTCFVSFFGTCYGLPVSPIMTSMRDGTRIYIFTIKCSTCKFFSDKGNFDKGMLGMNFTLLTLSNILGSTYTMLMERCLCPSNLSNSRFLISVLIFQYKSDSIVINCSGPCANNSQDNKKASNKKSNKNSASSGG